MKTQLSGQLIIFTVNRMMPISCTPLAMFEGFKISVRELPLCFQYQIVLPEIFAN